MTWSIEFLQEAEKDMRKLDYSAQIQVLKGIRKVSQNLLSTEEGGYGELVSSDEGQMHWIKIDELHSVNLVGDFDDLLDVMLNENLSEFQYIIEDDEWVIVKK